MIDTLAVLRQAGILDGGGRLVGEHLDLADVDGARVAVGAGVHFNQHDVAPVQLAKAAIRTAASNCCCASAACRKTTSRWW